jgi:ubiquinone/menaquinone biosynthesis C-methylase UbiE
MSTLSCEAQFSIDRYTPRASKYDTSSNAFHAELGRDFVKWISPKPGQTVLDLACGTGLVTIPMAEAVGPSSQVVGIDITPAMLAEARKKPLSTNSALVTWIEHDITSISNLTEIRNVVDKKGGFDIISCCSALVLLPDPAEHIKSWSRLLKPGSGRMIVDVLTPARTLLYLSTIALPKALGLNPTYRDWVVDIHSLEHLFQAAGLNIETSFEHLLNAETSFGAHSYIGDHFYEAHERDAVFEEVIQNSKLVREHGKVEGARQLWPKLWEENLTEDRKFHDGNWLYVTIGRKV